MTNPRGPSRPIGWWLKEADARLDAAFDRHLLGRNVDRRGWQILATLARNPTPRDELVASLTAFDSPAVVDTVLSELSSLGWIDDSTEVLRLTVDGQREHVDLAPIVAGVREQVAAALPQEDYVTLIGLLERLVTALK
jgi:hypothetical protein